MLRPIATANGTRSIVVVDGDPGVLNLTEFALGAEGFTVIAFSTAEDMLAASAADSANCFVLDQRLPGLSGLDLFDLLRAAGFKAPALLVTSQPSTATRARAHALGVEIVEKPLLGDTLVKKVRAAVDG